MSEENNIYIVDDDISARKGLTRLLRAAGFNVSVFSSSSLFLQKLQPNSSGCLLLDLRMPGMSCKELVENLNARDIHIKIIVISGNDYREIKKMARTIGAVGFFRKPVDGNALLDAINWSLKIEDNNNSHIKK